MKPAIEALPGKVVLAFPEAAETMRAGIIIPETSRRRVELAKLVHIGDATNPEEEIRRRAIVDAHRRGRLFAIPVSSGLPLYQIELGSDGRERPPELGDFAWLKSLRAYAISQLHTSTLDPGDLRFPELATGAETQ